MKFYSFPPSPNVRKVNAVIAHLGVADIEHQLVNLAKGEHKLPAFLAINPMGRLPALIDDGGLVLWESNAICQFLCERHGPSPFYPRDPRIRADIARWLFWEASTWSKPAEILTHENVRKAMLGVGEPDAIRVKLGEEEFRPLCSVDAVVEVAASRILGFFNAGRPASIVSHTRCPHFLVHNRRQNLFAEIAINRRQVITLEEIMQVMVKIWTVD